MDNVDKFLDLFSDFEFIIVPKIKRTKSLEELEPQYKTKTDLKKALRRLETEYKQALKSFKSNKISRAELHDFEWRIFELQEEIKRIEQKKEGED